MSTLSCFLPGCKNRECTVLTRREVLYRNTQDSISRAYISVSFCSLRCEHEFLNAPGRTGIDLIRTLAQTHLHYIQHHGPRDCDDAISLDELIAHRNELMEGFANLVISNVANDPYRVSIVIPTAGELGISQAEVRLKFASKSERMAFADRCSTELLILWYLEANYRPHKVDQVVA